MSILTDKAAGAFVKFSVEISRWEGIAQLNKGARDAAIAAGANPEVFRGYVNLLGSHHRALKHVKSLYMRVYTYLYENCLPFSRGVYMVLATAYPKVLADLTRLIEDADAERDSFLLDYVRLIKIAQSVEMGMWSDEVQDKYPSVESIRRRFGVRMTSPRTLDGRDIRSMNLPVDLMDKIASEQTSELEEQLEAAHQAAIALALKQVTVVATQLSDGKRLHDTLISNTQRVSTMLRDMSVGYLPDPRLVEIADQLDEHIGTSSIDKIKSSFYAKHMARDTAIKARDGLAAIAKSASPSTFIPSGNDANGTDLLADLI